jgi:hypothetical protein
MRLVTWRYHIITIVSIFLSLGIGIILGGSFGQDWMVQNQKAVLQALESKYEMAMEANRELQRQIDSLSATMQMKNEEFVRFLEANYKELNDKSVSIWTGYEVNPEEVKAVLTRLGMNVEDIADFSQIHNPLIIVGKELPPWLSAMEGKVPYIHIKEGVLSPMQQWELLSSLKQLIEEKK